MARQIAASKTTAITTPTTPPSTSRYSHFPPKPSPLTPHSRSPPQITQPVLPTPKIQRAKIILGFSGIGKTHLAAHANREFEWLHVIDYSLERHHVDFSCDYQTQYLQTVAAAVSQPGVLLLGGPRWVGEFLVRNNWAFSSVFPGLECREEYAVRWDQMGEEGGLVAHRLVGWEDAVGDMWWGEGRCNHFELGKGFYLEDVFMDVVTAADHVEGLGDGENEDEGMGKVWYDAHEMFQGPFSRRKRSRTENDVLRQIVQSLKSRQSSRIRSFLNYIFLILQFIFLCILATLTLLAYKEWNLWQSRNKPNLPTIGEFSGLGGLSRMRNMLNHWFLPDCISAILPNSRKTWLGASDFRKELSILVQKWLDLEESLLGS
ncbi:hypothetical protein BCIN_10g03740 [Botrytis cinerea B05.10]|uniref:Uncharacterized protein n=1 Tax=Botryotinia fuckeliana (strain B05.10) TaxID=332648 RepID=A0A384JUT6_BOTFB|nr:hypothetical protein BCIN_10g03740 [Botrytis cinerea B05.10]ATZ54366.1 hypothetical protein BCIN_10g03740 [Botrytis cinerea B05.10]